MDAITTAYVTGIEFLVSLVLHMATILKIWAILRKLLVQKNANEIGPKVSLYMMALLLAWLLNSLSYIPREVYILSVWRPVENVRHGTWLFWTFMPGLCQYSTVPVFVLFLTIERIFIIKLNVRYQNSQMARNGLFGALLLLATILWATNFVAFTGQLPVAVKTNCWTFNCLIGGTGMNFYLASRVVVAIPNLIGSIIFLCFLCKMNRKLEPNQGPPNSMINKRRARANRYNNLITLWAICSEFVLNFIPYFLPLIIQQLTGTNVLANLGVFASLLSSVEGLIFVCIYSRALSRMERDSSSLVQPQQQGKTVVAQRNVLQTRSTENNGANTVVVAIASAQSTFRGGQMLPAVN